MNPVLLSLLVFTASLVTTLGLVGWIMRSAAPLDVPNDRSLHQAPVPRGGGAAIVIVGLLALLVAAWWFPLSPSILWALLAVGLLLGGVGWLDDHYQLSIVYRLPVQIGVALLVLWLVGPLESLRFGGVSLPLGWLSALFTLLWIVWLSNLYNFMDGIDGLAAVETLVAALTIGLWFGVAGAWSLALFCAALAGGSAGFLWFNRPPARVFMGDVGSATLGGLFATLAVVGSVQYNLPLGAFLILFGYFIYDATFTLFKRLLRGEKWWQPHRSHLYQRAVSAGLSHGRVTSIVLLINLVLAVLASLELYAVPPRPLWSGLAIFLLLAVHAAVRSGEQCLSARPS
ncbi:MAG: glycosyltransferase family 4 protein [Pseudomonadota bacterium]|nr:glycosyltransferase family 4 protein [Pseudomonadota bacterium]